MDDINNYYLDDIDQIQSAADTTSAKKETKEAYYKIKELQDEYTGKKDS